MAAAGCGGGDSASAPAPAAPTVLRITSPVLRSGATVPVRFTCSGKDVSPPLSWSGVPAGAKELVLLVEDPDAPSGTFVHWSVSGIAPDVRGAPAGGPPRGSIEGENSFGDRGWRGPCPPEGDDPHRYRFLIYALGQRTHLHAGAGPDDVHTAIERSRPLGRGALEVRFGR